jgi:hypothetical protein
MITFVKLFLSFRRFAAEKAAPPSSSGEERKGGAESAATAGADIKYGNKEAVPSFIRNVPAF